MLKTYQALTTQNFDKRLNIQSSMLVEIFTDFYLTQVKNSFVFFLPLSGFSLSLLYNAL